MIVYISAFTIAIAFSLLADLTSPRHIDTLKRFAQRTDTQALHTYALFCTPLSLLFITCLRYGVGYDYLRTYTEDYYSFKQGLEIHSDIGFQAFYFISQLLSPNPQVLFIITGTILILGFYISAYLLSGSATFSLCLLFLGGTYIKAISMIAQYTAVVFLLLAFSIYFGRRKFIHRKAISTVLTVLAPTFHVSAVFPAIILLILFYKQNITKETIVKVSIIAPIVTLAIRPFLTRIVLFIISHTRFDVYIDSEFVGIESKSLLYIETIIFIIISISVVLHIKECSVVDTFILLFSSISVCFILLQSIPLMFRLVFYFSAFNVIGLPIILKQYTIRWQRYAISAFILLLLACWFYLYPYPKNTDGFLPYAFIFSPERLFY